MIVSTWTSSSPIVKNKSPHRLNDWLFKKEQIFLGLFSTILWFNRLFAVAPDNLYNRNCAETIEKIIQK